MAPATPVKLDITVLLIVQVTLTAALMALVCLPNEMLPYLKTDHIQTLPTVLSSTPSPFPSSARPHALHLPLLH